MSGDTPTQCVSVCVCVVRLLLSLSSIHPSLHFAMHCVCLSLPMCVCVCVCTGAICCVLDGPRDILWKLAPTPPSFLAGGGWERGSVPLRSPPPEVARAIQIKLYFIYFLGCHPVDTLAGTCVNHSRSSANNSLQGLESRRYHWFISFFFT